MNEEPKRAGRGCFFYGCMGALALTLVGGFFAYFGIRHAMRKLLATYTETAPASLPKAQLSDNQLRDIRRRLEEFNQTGAGGKPSPTLELAGDELDVFIDQLPDTQKYKDQFRLGIEGDEIKGKFSIPLEQLGITFLKGRYLNGNASFAASITNGALSVNFKSLDLNGKKLPKSFWAKLRAENLAKDSNKNPEFADKLKNVESLEVKDGKLRIRIKPPEAPQ